MMLTIEERAPDFWVFDYQLVDATAEPTLFAEDNIDHFYRTLETVQQHLLDGYDVAADILLRKLIKQFPDAIDAWVMLAIVFEEQHEELQSYLASREAVRIGTAVLPPHFDWSTAQLDWGELDNRPFLRAYHHLSGLLWRQGQLTEAQHILEQLLSVCPNDNLGVRCELPAMYLASAQYDKMIALQAQYPEDFLPELVFHKPLALALKGDMVKARAVFAEAEEDFPKIAHELRKKRHPSPRGFYEGQGVTLGSAEQAYIFWQEFGEFWKSDTALALVAKAD